MGDDFISPNPAMWEELKERLERRVAHMTRSGNFHARLAAYEDVLLLMEDIEEQV